MEEEQVQRNETAGEPAAEERETAAQQPEPAPEQSREQVPDEAALADEICARWQRQAEAAREFFPGLDLGREMENPRFQNLLLGGAEVEDAYFVTHRAEILPALMSYTARTVEEKLAGALRTGVERPGENGAGGQSAAAPRLDARRMDRAEFQSLCRKVAAGERISMG